MHEGHIVLVRLEIAHDAEVGERLVHDNDNVRGFRPRLTLIILRERLQSVCAVPLRRAHNRPPCAAQEVVELAVGAARRPEIDARARDAEPVVNGIRRERNDDERTAAPHIPPLEQLPAALHQADEHAVQHRRAHAAQHGQLDRCRVTLRDVGRRADGEHVAQHDRRAAEQHDVVVDEAVQQADAHADADREPAACGDEVGGGVQADIAQPALPERLLESHAAALDHVLDRDHAHRRCAAEQQQVMQQRERCRRLLPRTQHERQKRRKRKQVRGLVEEGQRAFVQDGPENRREAQRQQHVRRKHRPLPFSFVFFIFQFMFTHRLPSFPRIKAKPPCFRAQRLFLSVVKPAALPRRG